VPGNARARSFDSVADQYAAVRPGYPDSMYRFITGAACLCSQSKLSRLDAGPQKHRCHLRNKDSRWFVSSPGGALLR
jgi:hypothetical protein